MTRQRRPSVTRGEALPLRNSSKKSLPLSELFQINDHWSQAFSAVTDATVKKKVNFGTIHVRFYKTIVGDSPSCSGGPPLALGWEIQEELEISTSVDVYETCSPPNKKKDWEILLPRPDREERLLDAGFTRQDLARATAATARARQLQTRTVLNLKFMKVQELLEEIHLKTIPATSRKHPKWLYNEWEKSVQQRKCTRPLYRWVAEQQTKVQGHHGRGLRASGLRDSNVAFRMSTNALEVLQASPSMTSAKKAKWTPEELERLKQEPPFGIVEIIKNTSAKMTENDDGETKEAESVPFAKVDFVYDQSPIQKAGIQPGDLLYSFGSLTNCEKGELGRQIQRIVAAAAAEEIQIGVIQRKGGPEGFKTTVSPRAYDQGPGNLGWLISPYNNNNQ